jgi:glycerophosphoryl diester phosphodiesterase
MQIISHRGYWHHQYEKNTQQAFERSCEHNFGTETDVRDYQKSLVIAHDMPNGNELSLKGVITIMLSKNLLLALNIKSDGLAEEISKALKSVNYQNWFVFDMSIPDMLQHIKIGNPVFTRVSELEQVPALYAQSIGIWLDSFYSEWYSIDLINEYLKDGKKVCIVSPELHKRNHIPLWETLRNYKLNDNVILCTDFPNIAKTFFEI